MKYGLGMLLFFRASESSIATIQRANEPSANTDRGKYRAVLHFARDPATDVPVVSRVRVGHGDDLQFGKDPCQGRRVGARICQIRGRWTIRMPRQ